MAESSCECGSRLSGTLPIRAGTSDHFKLMVKRERLTKSPRPRPTREKRGEPLLCSNCFTDQGLRLDAAKGGTHRRRKCPQCHTTGGAKLDAARIEALAHRFFVWGSIQRFEYGAAPLIQAHRGSSSIDASEWLKGDIELIGRAIGVGFFPYGPRMWMLGQTTPLESLQDATLRPGIIARLLAEYPVRTLSGRETLYRLRKKPADPKREGEYDSPPTTLSGSARFDSAGFPIMYASQDLEVCLHECRVTAEDDLFVATLRPTRTLKLLNLAALLEEDTNEFESLDLAVHMLFLAGSCSYPIAGAIAQTTRDAGFDGLIYPSYFSLVRLGLIPFPTVLGLSIRRFPGYRTVAEADIVPNVALFGRPIAEDVLKVECINRVVMTKVDYRVVFGPVQH